MSDGFITISYFDEESYYCEDKVIPETVGQFTGSFTEKQGKEIYEGDIVKFDDISDLGDDLGEISIVEYLDYRGCYEPLAIGYCGCYYSRHIENTEIIGNIHDNPELAKGASNDNG